MTVMQVGLDDKYRFEAKRIYLSGVQALVRLPMLQRERDRAAGLTTGGFISGYRRAQLHSTVIAADAVSAKPLSPIHSNSNVPLSFAVVKNDR